MLRLEALRQKEEKRAKFEKEKIVSFVDKKTKELFIIYIDNKDIKLFNQAKEQSKGIFFLIENLEFLQVDYVVEW